ncbi:MAG: YbhB/YbcL family Raf kinase inhibitor-like protein [Candidatus Promineifilaceae bacterium]|nr:YbhB/YbcL family Raf kinase inhibitor-like protein [Candidatus Promineifilaceae bacterium]
MGRFIIAATALLLLLSAFIGCTAEEDQLAEVEETEVVAVNLLTLRSPAFTEGDFIPPQYTCDGADIAPPLTWHDLPSDVESYALIVDDPDAPGGTWTHWIVYNIPPEVEEFPEDLSSEHEPALGVEGVNSWGESGYRGPCPPEGEHRYFFKLFALNTVLDLEAGADRDAVLEAINGHILAEGQLMGVYERQ